MALLAFASESAGSTERSMLPRPVAAPTPPRAPRLVVVDRAPAVPAPPAAQPTTPAPVATRRSRKRSAPHVQPAAAADIPSAVEPEATTGLPVAVEW
jgi:hypothetical protein